MMKHPAMPRVILSIALLLAGCAGSGTNSHPFAPADSKPQINPRVLQQDLMSFADRFTSAIADAYDQLEREATTARAKDAALNRKVATVTAAIVNAVDDNPAVGLLDMLVLTSLTRASAEDSRTAELFGENAARIIEVHKRQEDELWQMATQYLTFSQIAELRESIERWRRENPDQHNVAMVRLSDFSRKGSDSTRGQRGPGSIFSLLFLDPFSSIDPAVREVERSREAAERMFYYFQRMPMLMAGQAELASRRSLEAPQFDSFLGDTSRFTDSTLKFAEATGAVADSIKQYPEFLTQERQRAVDQAAQKVAEQRDAAIQQLAASVATERDAAIKQIAAAVATERNAAITQATTRASAESDRLIERFGAMLQSERADLIHDTDAAAKGLIDRIVRGQVIVVLISVVAVVAGAVVYRLVRPR
jgi:hypothetical protein